MRAGKKEGFKDAGHEMNFKPAKTIKRTVKADFVHLTDHREPIKPKKDEDGHVLLAPINFLTNPPKRGHNGKGTSFGGNVPYIADPYGRAQEISKKEREEHLTKV
jgi:hypothetical protein